MKLNGLRHGLRARTVILPGENADDFHQLCEDLEAEWHPQSRTEHFYLEQMATIELPSALRTSSNTFKPACLASSQWKDSGV